MKTRYGLMCLLILAAFLLVACQRTAAPTETAQPTGEGPVMGGDETGVGLPNPASVYCEEQGGKVEIQTDASGAQTGICVFPDGSACDEWAYYRGECVRDLENTSTTYTNETYGFTFKVPLAWEIAEEANIVTFTRDNYQFFVGYLKEGEPERPFRTGMPSGDFVDQAPIDFAGGTLTPRYLVAENKVKLVEYAGKLKVDDLTLYIWLDTLPVEGQSYQDIEIPAERIAEANAIVSSFARIQ